MSNSREMLVALSVGVIIISGSLYVSASDTTVEGTVSAVTETEVPTRQFIAPRDSDNDGVDDWAEELLADREAVTQAIDPNVPYQAPNSLTGRFSVDFFQQYLYSKGLGEAGYTKEELVMKATETLEKEARDRIYDFTDITIIDDNGVEGARRYGNQIAKIVMESSEEITENEVDTITRALNQDDPDRLRQLDPIIKSYQAYLEQTLATPVPFSLRKEHTDLINVYNALLNDLLAMRGMYNDPLLGLLRFKRYNDDVEALAFVYFNLDRALRREGVIYRPDEPGAVYEYLGELKAAVQLVQ